MRRDLLDAAEKCRQEKVSAAFELPLLYEGGFEKSFVKFLAIWSSPEIRHKRLQEKRSMNIDDILAREKQQLAPDEKLERADFAIINNGKEEELKSQLNCFFEYLRKEQK